MYCRITYLNRERGISSVFAGDDLTLANALFHLNYHGLLDEDFEIFKEDSKHNMYKLKFLGDGYEWEQTVSY